MGLSSAALILLFILSMSIPLPSLCANLPSHYSLPAIKSAFVEYVCSMWSLFSRSKEPILITPRNLFLLVNLIILFLFISLHLQQHAPAAAKRSSRKQRQQHKEKLIMKDKQAAAPLQASSLADYLSGSKAAAMEKEALISSNRAAEVFPESLDTEESLIAEAAPMQESCLMPAKHEGSLAETLPAVDSDCINGSDGEQIVLDEDGQLRLIGGPTVDLSDTKGSDAEKSENERLRLIESGKKIVLEEDGQLSLIEATNGSDAETIVLEEDGRLRLIDRPQLPSSDVTNRPVKSLSTGDDNYPNTNTDNYDLNDINHNLNYDNHSLNKFDCDIHNLNKIDTNSLNHSHTSLTELNNNGTDIIDCSLNHTNLSEFNNGTDTIDCSLSHTNLRELNSGTELNNGTDTIDCSLNHNLSHVDARFKNKSSSHTRASSRPIKVKKSESLDATWKAINNNNKGSANREHKNLIRQSSRQDFKPSRGGNALMRASNNNKLVRREPSINQDELNAKVESFIAKFNEQIRIQRQQSLLSYMQMVDRGA